jgi:hypothetical protein
VAFEIAPWLRINPLDYVNSAAAGGRLGLSRAELESSALQAGDRTNLGYAQLAGENGRASSALAERAYEANLENQARQAATEANASEAAAKLKEATAKSSLPSIHTLGDQLLAVTPEGFVTPLYNKPEEPKIIEGYRGAITMVDPKNGAVKVLRDAMPYNVPQRFDTVSETTKGVPEHPSYDVTTPLVSKWFGPDIQPSSFSTTNTSALDALPKGSTIVTNDIPATPSRTTSRRVPVATAALDGVVTSQTPGVKDLGPASGTDSVTIPPAQANEITRLTKDGRKAIFDADTKEFLRYAD